MSVYQASLQPWYRTLNAAQWKTLVATNLGWLFDGFETYALILTVGVALRQLLEPAQYPQIPAYAGTVIGLTLLGWGVGGMLGGILADYIGRKRMMVYAILAYSVMTGLSAIAWDWVSEWATGTSMMAELWPQQARGKGAGLMQCGLGLGFFVASFAWLFISPLGPGAWRIMYLLGVLPALLTLWIRMSIDESSLWQQADAKRRAALERKRAGVELAPGEEKLARFTLTDLFMDRTARRRTLIVFLMSLTTTLGWWGISTWVPPYIGSVAGAQALQAATWASYAGMAYTLGSVTGYVGFGFLADAFGRKPVTLVFFALAWALTRCCSCRRTIRRCCWSLPS
jgi:MFS family permease